MRLGVRRKQPLPSTIGRILVSREDALAGGGVDPPERLFLRGLSRRRRVRFLLLLFLPRSLPAAAAALPLAFAPPPTPIRFELFLRRRRRGVLSSRTSPPPRAPSPPPPSVPSACAPYSARNTRGPSAPPRSARAATTTTTRGRRRGRPRMAPLRGRRRRQGVDAFAVSQIRASVSAARVARVAVPLRRRGRDDVARRGGLVFARSDVLVVFHPPPRG